jgi:hypothetical protein
MSTFDSRLAGTLRNKWKLRLWMLRKLPMGLLSGMYITALDASHCTVLLKDRWWIHNPFRSVFWAVMSMAAELSTGALLVTQAQPAGIQFILVGFEAKFLKKAKGKSFYFCHTGEEVARAISNTLNTTAPTIITLPVLAQDTSGALLAEFKCYWQLRKPTTP